MGGDFNVVCFPSERLGKEAITTTIQDFSNFIFSHGLMDVHMDSGLLTWSNNLSRSLLDRFLFATNLEEHFSSMIHRRLPRLLSYHFPILLECIFYEGVKVRLDLKTCG